MNAKHGPPVTKNCQTATNFEAVLYSQNPKFSDWMCVFGTVVGYKPSSKAAVPSAPPPADAGEDVKTEGQAKVRCAVTHRPRRAVAVERTKEGEGGSIDSVPLNRPRARPPPSARRSEPLDEEGGGSMCRRYGSSSRATTARYPPLTARRPPPAACRSPLAARRSPTEVEAEAPPEGFEVYNVCLVQCGGCGDLEVF